jgi:hypothetical protein
VIYPVERPDPAVTTNARLKVPAVGNTHCTAATPVASNFPVPTSVYAPERSVYTAHVDESTLSNPLMTSATVVVAFLVAALGENDAALGYEKGHTSCIERKVATG